MSRSIDKHEINNDNDDGHQDVIVQTASREAADAASFYESAYVIDDDDDDTTNDVEFELESTITRKKQKDSNYNDTFNYNGNKSPSRKGNGKYHNHQTNNNEEQRIEGRGVESDEEDDLVETVAMEISITPDRRNKFYLCCYRRHCRYQKIFCCFKHSNEFDLGEDDDNNVPSVPQTKQNSQTNRQQRPTNEKLLSIAFLSFFGFTCLQSLAAYLAQSEAMMGDSVAMAVDAFTYLFNLCAERSKNQQDDNDDDDDDHNQLNEEEERIVIVTERLQHRKKRKTKLILEIVPPLISVTTLIIVTTIILNEAIKTLVLDAHRDETMQDNPNLIVMLVFSTLNLVVDAGNIFFFAKADHLTGYSTMDDDADDYGENGYDDDDGDGDDDVEIGVQMITPTKRRDAPSNRKQGHRSSNSSTNTASSSISTRTQKRNAIGRVKQNLTRMKKERRRRRGGAYSHIAINDGDDNDNDDDTSLEHELVLIESEDDLRIEDLSAEQQIRTIGTPQSGEGTSIDEEDDLDEIDEDAFVQNPAEENEKDDVDHDDGYKEHNTDANLNMCSAYTHVFADTIRSIAVLVAAILAEVSDIVTSEVADAAAAVVVSGVILLALLPLFAGLRKSIQELNAIRREEKDEKMIESCLGEQE